MLMHRTRSASAATIATSSGSDSTVRIHSCQGTAAAGRLDAQSADEKPARSVDMRQREQEARVAGMGELRPFVTERFDLEAARGHDRLVLVAVDRADGIDER